jgi:hypothetical protein
MQRVSADFPRLWTTLTYEGLFYSGFTVNAFSGNLFSAFGTISAMGYYSNGGPLEALAHRFWNGTLIPLDNLAVARRVIDREGFLAALDEATGFATVDGVPASAFYLRSPSAVAGQMWRAGPRPSDPALPWEGRQFGIIVDNAIVKNLTSINTRQPIADGAVSFAGFFPERYFDTKVNNATYKYSPWRMNYAVSDPSGNVVRSGILSGQTTISGTLHGFINEPATAYRIDACVALDDGTCDANFKDLGYTLHLPLDTNLDSTWLKGQTIVILNGPRFDQWADPSIITIKSDGGATAVHWYPGLLVLDGATRDIVLDVAGRTRTISPDTGGVYSRIAYLTDRPQPFLRYVGDPVDNLPTPIVVGGTAILNGWNLTRGETKDEATAVDSPCEPEVWMNDSAGNLRTIPVISCSFLALRVWIPNDTAPGDAAFVVGLAEGSSGIIRTQVMAPSPVPQALAIGR